MFSFSFTYFLWSAGTAKSNNSASSPFLLIITRPGRLAEIWSSVYTSKSQKKIVFYSPGRIFQSLAHFQSITVPNQSYLVLYSFCSYFAAFTYCYVLTFWPGQKCHSRWCTGRRWHILVAVMRGNRVGGNWLMKWDEQEKFPWYTTEWCTGREWPLNCMTVISAWWRLNILFQRSSGRRTII